MTHNITSLPRKIRIKQKIREHKTKILLAGTGAAALASAYLYGKEHGEVNVHFDIHPEGVGWAADRKVNVTHEDKR